MYSVQICTDIWRRLIFISCTGTDIATYIPFFFEVSIIFETCRRSRAEARPPMLKDCMRQAPKRKESGESGDSSDPASKAARVQRADLNANLFSGFNKAAEAVELKMQSEEKLLQMRLEADERKHALDLASSRLKFQVESEQRAFEFCQQMALQQEQMKMQLAFTSQLITSVVLNIVPYSTCTLFNCQCSYSPRGLISRLHLPSMIL